MSYICNHEREREREREGGKEEGREEERKEVGRKDEGMGRKEDII